MTTRTSRHRKVEHLAREDKGSGHAHQRNILFSKGTIHPSYSIGTGSSRDHQCSGIDTVAQEPIGDMHKTPPSINVVYLNKKATKLSSTPVELKTFVAYKF